MFKEMQAYEYLLQDSVEKLPWMMFTT